MQLTVREVAKILNVSEKTVYRWIQQGSLPAQRVNDQYRLNRAELLEFATSRRIEVSAQLFEGAESGEGAPPGFLEALTAGGIHYEVGGEDKESALRAAVEAMALPVESDRALLLQVLLAREDLASTGVGDGVAIPHARSPIVLRVQRPAITLCFLRKAIDFDAVDGKPVHCLFTLVSPTVRSHLHLLSRLAFALRDPAFKKAIERRAPREEILEAARRVEERTGAAAPAAER
jgi:PTS system nitrogen regulatory IIA component